MAFENTKFRRSADKLDRLLKGGDDEVFKRFFKPTNKLCKIVDRQLGLNAANGNVDWFETWVYLICCTKAQCISNGVPFDDKVDTKSCQTKLSMVQDCNIWFESRWNAYNAAAIDPSVPNEKIQVEKTVSWAKLYVRHVLSHFQDRSGSDLSDAEFPYKTYLAIASQAEILAESIRKKL